MTTKKIIVHLPILPENFKTLTCEKSGLYSENASWIDNRWVITEGHSVSPDGIPFKSIVFLDPMKPSKSFEIKTENAFGGATMSPNKVYVAYINFNQGPHSHYITLAQTSKKILDNINEPNR